jgi:ATPase family associated with various cellular activities (AAA)
MADPISPDDFGASFKGFMQQMASQGPSEEPFFRRRLTEHFGADPSKLTIISEKFTDSDHPNLHLAIDGFVTSEGRTHELLGLSGEIVPFGGVSLATLVAPGGTGLMGNSAPTEGPVKYLNLELADGKGLACVQLGLYLVKDGDKPLAILVHGEREMFGSALKVEVLAAERTAAEACLSTLRKAMKKRNVYRGHVVSLSTDEQRTLKVHFHRLPGVSRDDIILPQGLLERIERQSIGFAKHAEKLLAAKRHLKRGLLLHGPPGTGKTFTAMYLAGRMPDRTVLLITGRAVNLLGEACAMARALQPATLILEDIDLIAQDRQGDPGSTPMLFELLNQMDGLAEDADILFVLTTNRPEVLEPALKSRPGRIDLALEVPVPDLECRRRLFELYGRGLKISAPLDDYLQRTQGASAAFIRELFRRTALYAAEGTGELELKESHFSEALHEMLMDGGPLTRSLLGFKAT